MVAIVDEYFTSLLRDIGGVISGICSLVEFILGVSYFFGATLVGWIVSGCLATGDFLHQVWEVLQILGWELWDFGGSLVRGVLLIQHGIGVIAEAFYITALDIHSSIAHILKTILFFLISIQTAAWNFVDDKLKHVPSHLLESAVFVGDACISCLGIVGGLLFDFGTQLVVAPLKALQVLGLCLLYVAYLPVQLYNTVPLRGLIGLVILGLSLYSCWRLRVGIMYRVVNSLVATFKAGGGGVRKMFSVIKDSKHFVEEVRKARGRKDDTLSKDPNAMCVICREEVVSFIAKPCKHVCLCSNCVYRLPDYDTRCPMCRKQVSKFEKVYIPS